jgi:hypothetical protein
MGILNENSKNSFIYLTVAAIIILIIFLIYIFQVNHKYDIDDNTFWSKLFKNAGFSASEILNITHDDDTWYYNGLSTCVAYSNNPNTKCKKSDYYCPGKNIVGTPQQQVEAVRDAINNNGEHILCPRIYYAFQ